VGHTAIAHLRAFQPLSIMCNEAGVEKQHIGQ
jgi:hypothetical protein